MERIAYYAAQADSRAFGRRLQTVAQAERFDYSRSQALLGDGAEWIWQEEGMHFPRSLESVELFQLLQYLWAVARARFGAAAAHAWVEAQKKRLLANQAEAVIAAVAAWEPSDSEGAEPQRNAEHYVQGRVHRMQYQTYQGQGFHLDSGVTEADCKQVVQAWLKGTAMRWREGGAEAMLHLRAVVCSSDYIDFRDAARRAIFSSKS